MTEIDYAWKDYEDLIDLNLNNETEKFNGPFGYSQSLSLLYQAEMIPVMLEYLTLIVKDQLNIKTSEIFLSINKICFQFNDKLTKVEVKTTTLTYEQLRTWKQQITLFSTAMKELSKQFKQISNFIIFFLSNISNEISQFVQITKNDSKMVLFKEHVESDIILTQLKRMLLSNFYLNSQVVSTIDSAYKSSYKNMIEQLFYMIELKWFRSNPDVRNDLNDQDRDLAEEQDEEEEREDGEGEKEIIDWNELGDCWDVLGLLGGLESEDMNQHLSSIIANAISQRVYNNITAEFCSPKLNHLLIASESTLMSTLRLMFSKTHPAVSPQEKENEFYSEWSRRIKCWVHTSFCEHRIPELYDCILEYPDSATAVMELSNSLEYTQLHGRLAVELRQTLKRRLLHPGATTAQIIDIYISTIKVLRLLESSCDGVLDAVAAPLRDYLRERKDCVRRIVTSLTDEEADLYEELQRNQGNEDAGGVGDREEDMEDESVNWKPQLRSDALMKKLKGEVNASGPKQGAGSDGRNADAISNRHKFDILGNLLSIYGSKEVFIDEYRVMLCSRLLQNYNYDTSRDVATLELLKLRFGEAVMYQCEIMIRDIDESKRLNTSVHSKLKSDKPSTSNLPVPIDQAKGSVVDATVVSEHFWPSLEDSEGIILHPIAAELLAQYNKTYTIMKKPRELKWREQIGLVDLELEFKNGSCLKFNVSPLHATLILHFDEDEQNEELTVSELVQLSGMDQEEVKKKMDYWVHEGVVTAKSVKQKDGEFEYHYIAEKFPFASGSRAATSRIMEVESFAKNKDKTQDKKVFRNFVLGMLKNLDSMPLERVHNMLKMYTTSSETKYEMSTAELNEFLNEMITDDAIEYSSGEYSLVRK